MKDKLVLIVEEDEEIVEAIAEDLLDYQMEAVLASDVNEAQNLIKKFRKDIGLILCDFGVDGDNGILVKEFLLDENYKIPFVLLAEELTDGVIEDAERLGIKDVLVKPVDVEVVREILEVLSKVA